MDDDFDLVDDLDDLLRDIPSPRLISMSPPFDMSVGIA
jgi:hypothetical protein